MPDIAMCCNIKCSLKQDCYRFRAIPSKFRQSYMLFKPNENDSCSHLMGLYKDGHYRPMEEINVDHLYDSMQKIYEDKDGVV